MTGWREVISKTQYPESIRSIRSIHQVTGDEGEIADCAHYADGFQDIENEKQDSTDFIQVAKARLSVLAKELDHPLEDLLDWYQEPDDMRTLGSISMDETRKAVAYYVKDLDLCRHEGYIPIGYKPPPPTEKTWVRCMDCQCFSPDSIAGGGGAGIGDCGQGLSPKSPCYPKAQRHCVHHQPITFEEHK